jgi:hypothetical protein
MQNALSIINPRDGDIDVLFFI